MSVESEKYNNLVVQIKFLIEEWSEFQVVLIAEFFYILPSGI